ncbi:MAG: serine/threonine-protein kinase [Cyanobacteria bacterium J06598_1]
MTSSLPEISHSATAPSPQPARSAKPLFKDRFRIVRRLGRGGYSTTYLAQDVSGEFPQPCVIKQLRYKRPTRQLGKKSNPEMAALLRVERNQRRFQKEARIMARIGRHSQLPCLLDHFVENGHFYIVQEHVPGLTLQQERQHHGLQNEGQIKTFLREMVEIIRHVHRHNLLHLDIKPANIIRRCSDQKLVLIDFGAVRSYTAETPSAETLSDKADANCGTVGFAPAEQLEGQPVPASDLYSLGVTCLYLLTGCSPLDLATSPRGQNLRWQESVQVSEHLTHILSKLLAPEAKHRFQSVDELERSLNLETHYTNLKPCMTREPLSSPAFKNPAACLLQDYADASSSQSGASRQAASIRRWQQRRRQFKSFVPK